MAMYFSPVERHLPKSPLAKRDNAVRAELTALSTSVVKLEREQEVQLRRIAQIQHELDDIKRLLKKLADAAEPRQ